MHEKFSTYILETSITKKAYSVFDAYDITNGDTIYIIDDENVKNTDWDGASKLKTTFSDQSFIDYYFPGKDVTVEYSSDGTAENDEGVIVIEASKFFE